VSGASGLNYPVFRLKGGKNLFNINKLTQKIICVLTLTLVMAVSGCSTFNEKDKSVEVINNQVYVQLEQLHDESLRKEQQQLDEQQRILEENKIKAELSKKNQQSELDKLQQPVKLAQKQERIPVLMYHSIDYEAGNELRIPKEKFREQMKYLKDNGFNTLSLDELYSHLTLGTELPQKPIVITLDDGYVDNYTNAYPVLKEFNQKAVVFMITKTVDTDYNYLTSEQIKEMDRNGMSIEPHTVNHPELDKLSYSQQKMELEESKKALEKLLGREMKYIAYPYGKYNNDTLKLAEELGYKMAFSTRSGLAEKSNGIYKLNRLYVSEKHTLEQFKSLVNMK
jgi:peptidoglycan/xylan/chitin deacetylase (PgdA/CDA1 family)